MPVTDEHIETAKAIVHDYGATRRVVFGSAVDDPENARDLDLAIEGVEGWAIWELAGKIERSLDIPVDAIPVDPSPFTEIIEKYGREFQLRDSSTVEAGTSVRAGADGGNRGGNRISVGTWRRERPICEIRPRRRNLWGTCTWESRTC